MTERFNIEILDENNWLIEDQKTGQTLNPIDGTATVLKGLINLLNKYYNENKQLNFELKECEEHKLFSRRKLEDENKQLKQRVKQLEDNIVNKIKIISGDVE